MSRWEIVKRPEIEPHSGDDADPQQDWRRFVLAELGYDEEERARRARRIDWRGFFGGLLNGAILFAVAFGVILAALLWRDGAFDRFVPVRGATVEAPPNWVHANLKPAPVAAEPASGADHPPWPDPYAQPAAPPSATPQQAIAPDESAASAGQ
jgi:hypothetical protein